MEEDRFNLDDMLNAVRTNQCSLLRKLLSECSPELNTFYGDEGSILNVGIQNAGLEVLVSLLGVEYPVRGGRIELSKEKYESLGKACSADGLTPLMQAVKCGKKDIVAFLIGCGVSVNAVNKSKASAIDYSSDVEIALVLLRADSLLHSLRGEDSLIKLEKFMSESEGLKEFFEKRDKIHEAIKRGCSDEEVKELIGSEESQYLINRKGESALWQAAEILNVDVWAYLNSRRMKCASVSEEESMKFTIASYEDRFNRSLIKYFFEVRGTHVMKIVAKSRAFGKRGEKSWDVGRRMQQMYEALDEYEETQIVLEVLQDEHDFEVVFDFESDSVKHTSIKSLGANDWGLTDFHQKRVYVGAQERSLNDRCNVLGTLSHELTHKALMVVFKNQGKPYLEGDSERMKKYQSILQEIMCASNFMELDEVIRRVAKYEKEHREQELIVRVPEIIAKYCNSLGCEEVSENEGRALEDGIELLEGQVKSLLNYYQEEVMPAFRQYVDSIFTSNKMTVKVMSDFQRLLLNSTNGSISVGSNVQDIEKHIHCHNGLKVLLVSCIELCHSHLKLVHGRRGENVLLVGWSQYDQAKKEYMDGLSNGAYDLLVVRWDGEEVPKFCRRTKCSGDCIGNVFGGMSNHVIMVVSKAVPSLKKLSRLEYLWPDLSDTTKSDILMKRVNFVGCTSTVKGIISKGVGGDHNVEAFMKDNMISSDISLLLKDEIINIGKITGSTEKGSAEVIDQRCYMKRHFSERCVSFSDSLVESYGELFVVCYATISDLQCLKISESIVRVWNVSNLDKGAKFYVVNETVVESFNEVFKEICNFHSDKKGIHLLEFKNGNFVYIKSHGSVAGLLGNVTYDAVDLSITEEKFLQQKICLPSAGSDCDISVALKPVIIADEPGCGKSFALNNFVSECRKTLCGAWIVVVDLNFYAQKNSPVDLGKIGSSQTQGFEDLVEVLFKMVGHGNSSFERSIFKHYCHQFCKVIVMFDGFDEICPKYRKNVVEFLEGLWSKTAVKVCATTRLHERNELECKLNVISYKLIPFSVSEQVDFLCRYWKASLRKYSGGDRLRKISSLETRMRKWLMDNFPNEYKLEESGVIEPAFDTQKSESKMTTIQNIDFKIFAQKLILSIDSLFEDFKEFTRTPLHVKMFAFVLFEEDFIMGMYLDLGNLYEKFLDIKLNIFVMEKALASGNVSSDKSFGMAKKRIFELLENMSANEFFDPEYFQCDREEMYDALSIGLTVEKEETYQFIHRTFGEFFFAKWLLREAQRDLVTKFWLEQLFTDKSLFRVRWFLEDVMHSYYEMAKPSKLSDSSFTYKVTILSLSVFPDERLSVCLNACLFGIICFGFHSLLQYFATGYGCKLIKLLMGDQNFPSGVRHKVEDYVSMILNGRPESPINIPPEIDVINLKIRYRTRVQGFNAFTLAYKRHSSSSFKTAWMDRTFKVVYKMLSLIEEYEMIEGFNEVFDKDGLSWIFPDVNFDDHYQCYYEAVANFLIRKIGLVKSSLKKSFLYESRIWENSCSQDMTRFHLMSRIADISLENSDFEIMFLKNDDFFKLFLWVARYSCSDHTIEMWEYVKEKLSSAASKLEFFSKFLLIRSNRQPPLYMNLLISAMLSNDVAKVTLVWKFAMELMSREAFVEWFFTSMSKGCPSLLSCYPVSHPPAVLNFIRVQLDDGLMTEDEVVKIILLKYCEGYYVYSKFGSHEHLIESYLLLYKLIAKDLTLRAREILIGMDFIYSHLILVLGFYRNGRILPFALSNSCASVDEIVSTFQEIVINQSNVLDKTLVYESSPIISDPVLLSILALIHWYLELGWKCMGSELLFKFFKTHVAIHPSCPNILHLLLVYEIPCAVDLMCADLHKYLDSNHLSDLLFMKDGNGNSVFHVAARDGRVYSWGKYYDVARILLKEFALGDVHGIVNDNGKCVQDFFLCETN